ncbi:stage III sporulation protein AG [Inconstantimicrobium porci]|uniref:Stage III sporulation protein AG n=1 Tax=Inconstantimicrobium porci TaxID=2652291 RepID=A0A7X2MVZ2_9CLOT|nr:stage III sporulation protein AG [Inconstantimicrobium porci]MSR90040.1 stage III sporulation protein AG [Inconstantimicrobium porci]
MDKNFFNTIMKKENRWKLVISLLALILIYICISFFLDDLTLNKKASANVSNEQNQNGKNQTVENYEAQQKTDLKNILKKIDGIGSVEVMMSFESDETKVPAMDSNKQTSVTEETDNQGGKRTTNQQTDNSQVVMENKNGQSAPLIVKTYKPKVVGVMVVAEGADDSKIKYEISQAVSNLYGLSLDKVNVYPMKK